MGETKLLICDGCGKSSTKPIHQEPWIVVNDYGRRPLHVGKDYLACSWQCMARIAAQKLIA